MQALSGRYVVRFAIGAPLTEESHILEAWKIFQEVATVLLKSLKMNHTRPLNQMKLVSLSIPSPINVEAEFPVSITFLIPEKKLTENGNKYK